MSSVGLFHPRLDPMTIGLGKVFWAWNTPVQDLTLPVSLNGAVRVISALCLSFLT